MQKNHSGIANNQKSEEDLQNNNDQREQTECSKCRNKVDEVVALECDHDLCLGCSFNSYKKFEVFQTLKCDICNLHSKIDKSVHEALLQMRKTCQKVSANVGNKSQQQYNNNTEKNQQNRIELSIQNDFINLEKKNSYQSFQQQQQQDFNQKFNQYTLFNEVKENNNNNNLQQENQIHSLNCSFHKNEKADLFCFDCFTTCFCTDCFLSGKHRNHNVKDVRKNYQTLAQHIEDLLKKMKNQINLISKQQNQLVTKKLEIVDLLQSSKFQVQQVFQEFQQSVSQKQNEVLAKLEDTVSEKLNNLEDPIKKLEFYQKNITEVISALENSYYKNQQGEEAAAFNFYVDNRQKINLIINENQERIQNLNLDEQLSWSYQIDKYQFESFTQDIQKLQNQVLNLGGMNKLFYLGVKPTSSEPKYLNSRLLFEDIKDERLLQKFDQQIKYSSYKQSYGNNSLLNNPQFNQSHNSSCKKSNKHNSSTHQNDSLKKSYLRSDQISQYHLSIEQSLFDTPKFQLNEFGSRKTSDTTIKQKNTLLSSSFIKQQSQQDLLHSKSGNNSSDYKNIKEAKNSNKNNGNNDYFFDNGQNHFGSSFNKFRKQLKNNQPQQSSPLVEKIYYLKGLWKK